MGVSQVPELNTEAADGLDNEVAAAFLAALTDGLAQGNGDAVQRAAGTFLQLDIIGQVTALAPLTAMAVQLAGLEAQERVQLMEVMRQSFRQVLGSASELDMALTTQWPLWGLLHIGID